MQLSSCVYLIFTGALIVGARDREAFNPAGADYEGFAGDYGYGIYASAVADFLDAQYMCEHFYSKGRLAWLGELNEAIAHSISSKASVLAYVNLNPFFWIDGKLDLGNCNPETDKCMWVPIPDYSHVPRNVSAHFYTKHVSCLDRTQPDGSKGVWQPVLQINMNGEIKTVSEPYVIAVSRGNRKAGFICAYPKEDYVCPFGFTVAKRMKIPIDLKPQRMFFDDVCLQANKT